MFCSFGIRRAQVETAPVALHATCTLVRRSTHWFGSGECAGWGERTWRPSEEQRFQELLVNMTLQAHTRKLQLRWWGSHASRSNQSLLHRLRETPGPFVLSPMLQRA